MKNLVKGNAEGSAKKIVQGWQINTVHQILTLPQASRYKLIRELEGIPPRSMHISKRKWFHLLGVIYSAVPTIAGASGTFTRLNNALNTTEGQSSTDHRDAQ